MTPLTRQIGRAMLPTGDEFGPAGSDSTSVMVVSGRLRAAKVSRVQGAVVAAAGAGASDDRRDQGDGENKEKEAATHKAPPTFGRMV